VRADTIPAAAAAATLVLAAGPPAARAAFERAAHDANAAARGGLVALSDDGVWGNPAGGALPDPRRRGGGRIVVRADGSRPFGLPDLTDAQGSVAAGGARWAAGIGLRQFGSDLYAETEARLTLALARDATALGVAVRGLEAAAEGFAPLRSIAVDAAFRARAAGVDLAAALESVGGSIPGDPRGRRRRAALGAARSLARPLDLALEVQRRGDGPLAAVVGLTWRPVPPLSLHAGARQQPSALSWGFTLHLPVVAASLATTHVAPLGTTLQVGLHLGARAPQPATSAQLFAWKADAVGTPDRVSAGRGLR
jgi:hypothetical protein